MSTMEKTLPTPLQRWAEAISDAADALTERLEGITDEEEFRDTLAEHEWPKFLDPETALQGMGGACLCGADHDGILVVDIGEDGEDQMVVGAPTREAASREVARHLEAYGFDEASRLDEFDVIFITAPWHDEWEWQVFRTTCEPAAGTVHVWWSAS